MKMGSYLKRTDYLQRLKTHELIYQDINGDYPIEGSVPYFVDDSGTFGSSTITIDETGNMVIPGDLDVGGSFNFSGNLDISGSLNLGSIDISGSGRFGSLDVSGSGRFGSLDVSGNLKVNGSTELVGPVVARSTVAVAGTTTLTGTGNALQLLNGSLIAAGVQSTTGFTNVVAGNGAPAQFPLGLTTNGPLVAGVGSNATIIGSDSNTAALTVGQNQTGQERSAVITGRTFANGGVQTTAPSQFGSSTTPIQCGLAIYGNVSVAASAAGGGDAGFSGTVTANVGRFGSLDVSGVSSNTITLYPQPGMGTFASPIVLSDGQNFQAVGNKCFVTLSGDIAGSSARVITPIVPSGKAIPVNYLIYNGGPGASITVSPTTLDLTLTLSPSSPDASFAIVFL
jgi:hypothetical protein